LVIFLTSKSREENCLAICMLVISDVIVGNLQHILRNLQIFLKMSGNNLGKFKHMLARWGPQKGCPLCMSGVKSFATCWIRFYKYLIAREGLSILLPFLPLIPLYYNMYYWH
jgi:hypothetical protein